MLSTITSPLVILNAVPLSALRSNAIPLAVFSNNPALAPIVEARPLIAALAYEPEYSEYVL